MNASQAREVLIINYLKNINLNPKRETSQAYFYLSPFRNETKSSFKVDKKLNVWFDFGSGNGGSIIDLVMQLENVSFKQALHIIENLPSSTFFSFHRQKNKSSVISIKHVQSLQNKALIQYAESRKIPYLIAKEYVKEVYFTLNNKKQFALAFENQKGGFELRNKFWKGATSPKFYTLIKGSKSDKLTVFEGFFDFLSALVHFNATRPKYDCIVLNSTVNLKYILPEVSNYSKIFSFMDNDTTGQSALEKIKQKATIVENMAAKIYPNHNDFNSFLTS